MSWSLMVQFMNSGVTGIPYGSVFVNRIAVLARPVLLLNITLSNLEQKKRIENRNENKDGKRKGVSNVSIHS